MKHHEDNHIQNIENPNINAAEVLNFKQVNDEDWLDIDISASEDVNVECWLDVHSENSELASQTEELNSKSKSNDFLTQEEKFILNEIDDFNWFD